jgi:hypothetical protein
MLVTITEYTELARDANGAVLPLGTGKLALQSATAAGTVELTAGARFFRAATDTAILINDELMMPGSEYFPVLPEVDELVIELA